MSKVSDIVEILRENASNDLTEAHYEGCWEKHPGCATAFAADEIEWLRARIVRLEGLA